MKDARVFSSIEENAYFFNSIFSWSFVCLLVSFRFINCELNSDTHSPTFKWNKNHNYQFYYILVNKMNIWSIYFFTQLILINKTIVYLCAWGRAIVTCFFFFLNMMTMTECHHLFLNFYFFFSFSFYLQKIESGL